MQDGHAVAEAREELPRHLRRERDLRHHEQRAAALRQRRFDGGQIHFRLARPGDAVQQKGLEALGLYALVNLLERGLLRGVQLVARADRGLHRDGLRLERNQSLARQRPRRRARVFHRVFQFLQIVRARMQFQKGAQFPLGLVELGLRPLAAREPVPRAGAPRARAADRAPPALLRRR